MEPKGAAEKFMSLLEAGIRLSVIICDGDVAAIDEIKKAMERRWPGIDPAVVQALLPELKACINHKVKNMGCAAVPTSVQIWWHPVSCIQCHGISGTLHTPPSLT